MGIQLRWFDSDLKPSNEDKQNNNKNIIKQVLFT